jgi:hypothetical protein
MAAIDRVMRAYASKHVLEPSKAALVRVELAKFIDELLTGSRLAETTRGSDIGAAQQSIPAAVPDGGR